MSALALLHSFKDILSHIPAKQCQYYGSHHFELIKETCLQLKKISTCLSQQHALEKVMRLMIFARAFSECRCASIHFTMPNEQYLDVDAESLCGCELSESLPGRIEEWTAERTRVFFEELKVTCHLLDDGLGEGLFLATWSFISFSKNAKLWPKTTT